MGVLTRICIKRCLFKHRFAQIIYNTDFHNAVFIRAMFVIISVFYYRGSRDGIQPERLNAEGEARVLLAGG